MKFFQCIVKDGNELGDLFELEKKLCKVVFECVDGKDLLFGIGVSLLGVVVVGVLFWFGVFGGVGEVQQCQLDVVWVEGQVGVLCQVLQ